MKPWDQFTADFHEPAGAALAPGDTLERYDYSPYGQRRVFGLTHALDVHGLVPKVRSQGVVIDYYGVQFVYDHINEVGFQGLRHDEQIIPGPTPVLAPGLADIHPASESARGLTLVDQRRRVYDPRFGRFVQTDPLGYPDGLNPYAAYHVMWGGVDPWGLDFLRTTSSGAVMFVPETFFGRNLEPVTIGNIGDNGLVTLDGATGTGMAGSSIGLSELKKMSTSNWSSFTSDMSDWHRENNLGLQRMADPFGRPSGYVSNLVGGVHSVGEAAQDWTCDAASDFFKSCGSGEAAGVNLSGSLSISGLKSAGEAGLQALAICDTKEVCLYRFVGGGPMKTSSPGWSLGINAGLLFGGRNIHKATDYEGQFVNLSLGGTVPVGAIGPVPVNAGGYGEYSVTPPWALEEGKAAPEIAGAGASLTLFSSGFYDHLQYQKYELIGCKKCCGD